MRLDTFRSVGRKALGEGDDKKAFVDPREDERVILEIKKDGTGEKYSPRLLKGAFYLNKPIFILNDIPTESPFLEEIIGLGSIPLHSDLKLLAKSLPVAD